MNDDLGPILRPHDHVYGPETDGPVPTVLMFHGSSGRTPAHEHDWAAWFNAHGYAFIAVDSFAGRTVEPEAVSTGQALWGNERAADVASTITYAHSLERVDPKRLIGIGFSHGAWTLLDALVLHKEAAALAALIAVYPYSGPPAAHHTGWFADVPVLGLFAEQDTVVSTPHGIAVMEQARDMGRTVEMHTFPNTTHTFDHAQPNAANVAAGSRYDAEATAQARAHILYFLERYLPKNA